jgi:hypothetical protein
MRVWLTIGIYCVLLGGCHGETETTVDPSDASTDGDTDSDLDTDSGNDACITDRFVGALGGYGLDAAVKGDKGYFLGGAGFYVYDLSTPSAPEPLSWLTNFITYPRGLTHFKDDIWLVHGGVVLSVVDASEAQRPVILTDMIMASNVEDLAVKGDHAIVAVHGEGIQVVDLSDPSDLKVVHTLNTATYINAVDIHGEYAFLGSNHSSVGLKGVYIIDISTISSPKIAGSLDLSQALYSLRVKEEYAYAISGEGNIITLDVRDPLSPTVTSMVSSNAHKVVIFGQYLLACGGSLEIYDISRPAEPTLVGQFSGIDVIKGAAGYQDYILIGQANGSFGVVDVSTPEEPKSVYNEPMFVSNHIAIFGDYALSPQPDSGIAIIDISQPKQPKMVGHVETIELVTDVRIKDHYALFMDNDVLNTLDLSDVSAPVVVATTPIPNLDTGEIALHGNTGVIANRDLFQLVDLSDPTNPRFLGATQVERNVEEVIISDMLAATLYSYNVDGGDGEVETVYKIQLLDISVPDSPVAAGTYGRWRYEAPGGMALYQHYLLITDEENGLLVVDVSDPVAPKDVTVLALGETDGSPGTIHLHSHYAFVAGHTAGFYSVDLSDPEAPTIVDVVDIMGKPWASAVYGEYFVFSNSGLQMVRHCLDL